MRNPKVAKLNDKEFRLWVQLLSVASDNDGIIPPLEDLKHMLNRRLDHLSTGVEALLRASLIDRSTHGYTPHGWCKYQYKSDTSNERVTLHRKKRNVTVTAPDTDTDTDNTLSKDSGVVADSDKEFWASAKSYLGGKNPGSIIGKWCRDYPKKEVAKAIGAAQVERAVDPVPYIERVLRGAKSSGLEMPIC
jgi:predicted transcriptional regulator